MIIGQLLCLYPKLLAVPIQCPFSSLLHCGSHVFDCCHHITVKKKIMVYLYKFFCQFCKLLIDAQCIISCRFSFYSVIAL
uniref:Putative secreted protein n=1 Tax=Amblyomma triste TaxID=251400 RepID=A0A023G127_AMBTT